MKIDSLAIRKYSGVEPANAIEPIDDDPEGWGNLTPEQVAERKKHLFTTDIMPSRAERRATLPQREKAFNRQLKLFDPASKSLLEHAYSFGQEIVIESAIPEFVEYAKDISSVGSSLTAISRMLGCDNGPRTRAQLKSELGDLIKSIDELDTTVRKINHNPHSSLWVDVDNLQLGMVQDLRNRVKAFVSKDGDDQELDELREYLVQNELVEVNRAYTIGYRQNTRGAGSVDTKRAGYYITKEVRRIAEERGYLTVEWAHCEELAGAVYDQLEQIEEKSFDEEVAFQKLNVYTFVTNGNRMWKRGGKQYIYDRWRAK